MREAQMGALDGMVRARTGRTLGLTLYAQFGPEPGRGDTFLGLFDTPEDAQIAADALNGDRPKGVRWRPLGRLLYPPGGPIQLDDFFGAMINADIAATVARAVNGV